MDQRSEPKNEVFLDKLERYREASAAAEALAQEESGLLRALSERANFLERASTTDGASDERGKVIAAYQAMASRLREVQIARIEATAILNGCASNLIASRGGCSWAEADTGISGYGRKDQAVKADRLTIGSSLKDAMVAGVI